MIDQGGQEVMRGDEPPLVIEARQARHLHLCKGLRRAALLGACSPLRDAPPKCLPLGRREQQVQGASRVQPGLRQLRSEPCELAATALTAMQDEVRNARRLQGGTYRAAGHLAGAEHDNGQGPRLEYLAPGRVLHDVLVELHEHPATHGGRHHEVPRLRLKVLALKGGLHQCLQILQELLLLLLPRAANVAGRLATWWECRIAATSEAVQQWEASLELRKAVAQSLQHPMPLFRERESVHLVHHAHLQDILQDFCKVGHILGLKLRPVQDNAI
mmetsp:Transcript_28667/g.78673  ORF Transcript_28667/g.78673 Transcript_28667/m.78673 type:complete len:273 (-) Transcript_28667:83-901(-)